MLMLKYSIVKKQISAADPRNDFPRLSNTNFTTSRHQQRHPDNQILYIFSQATLERQDRSRLVEYI